MKPITPSTETGTVRMERRIKRHIKTCVYSVVVIEIPEHFTNNTICREGESGQVWIESLPGLVETFLQRWRCTPTRPVLTGAVGVILAVRRNEGTPAVLKVSFPHPGNMFEAHAFDTWNGHGAVRLYERDDARFAMLLEQAEWQTLNELGDVYQATAVTGQLARRLAVPAPPEAPRLADRAEEWIQALRDDSGRIRSPLSPRALDAAVATIQDLGRKQPDTMLHGDLHFGNVVPAQREPWLVVDPKGLVGDLAFDAHTVLLRSLDSLRKADDLGSELHRRLAIFADAAEIERERAVRWAQARAAIGASRGPTVDDAAWEVQFREHAAELLA